MLWILSKTTGKVANVFLKILAFLSSQMKSESKDLRRGLVTIFRDLSHQLMLDSEADGARCCQPYLRKVLNQISRLNTHWIMRWSNVSGCWMHIVQVSLVCSPCLARRSPVQTLPCKASQMKKRHLLGALIFHSYHVHLIWMSGQGRRPCRPNLLTRNLKPSIASWMYPNVGFKRDGGRCLAYFDVVDQNRDG